MSPKVNSIKLHGLAQKLHILLEDLSDLEERIMFLIKASGEIKKALTLHSKPIFIMEEIYMLEYLLSKCKHSKRWISNYRDRANIRINLVSITRISYTSSLMSHTYHWKGVQSLITI